MPHDYRSVSPADVATSAQRAVEQAEAIVAGIEASGGEGDFDSLLGRLDEAAAIVGDAYGEGPFLARVHPDPAVRDAGQAAEEQLEKWSAELPFREPLAAALRAFAARPEAAALTGEDALLLEHWLRDFRRAGHELPEEAREEVRRLRQRLVELEVAFQRNVDEDTAALELTDDELAGLPDTYLDSLAAGERPGTRRVTTVASDWQPFLENATRRDLRRRLLELVFTRAVEANEPLLREAIAIRDRMATLLGYPSWAHYAVEVKMARRAETVRRFYDELVPAVTERATPELERLTAELLSDPEAVDDLVLRAWDWRFYDQRLRRRDHGVDANAVSEYLPLEPILDGLFELTGTVFGLSYRRVEETHAWHPDVRLYQVYDTDSGEHLGDFYADLHPRDGKYSHAAAFPLRVERRGPDGRRVRPVSALVANLSRPAPGRPAVLRHRDMVTLFHEFGHILHMTLARARFSRFSAANTEWDFVEAPSQIMEHWAWDPGVLRRYARHHATGEPIPADLVERLVASRRLNVAVETLRQCSLGLLDLELHLAGADKDLHEVNRRTWAVSGLPFPEGTFFPASFGHLLGGYDAGYYGYLWAKVYGDDMFSRFEEAGVTDPAVGRDYRRAVLEPNGSRPALELLRDFLGREPSNAAFLRNLGLPAASAA
ncbi:MAG TPA: M3 family metallopeptidase [Candidatus Limnocylindrales bacterium]|nr:M3 family metallopeptidase [Candidatus Limnocylindrales bacterium]